MSSGDLTYDANVKVAWAATVADISAPTAAECTGATELSDDITPDGLAITFATAAVDNSALSSDFDTSEPGRSTPTLALTFKTLYSDGTSRPAATTLVKGAAGFLIVRRNKAVATAFAATDKVEVYPATCGQPSPAPVAKNEIQKASVDLFPSSSPDTLAVVAA
jgi:hypothetical protein